MMIFSKFLNFQRIITLLIYQYYHQAYSQVSLWTFSKDCLKMFSPFFKETANYKTVFLKNIVYRSHFKNTESYSFLYYHFFK